MWLKPLCIATQSHPVYRSHYVRESKVYLTNLRTYCCCILFLKKMFLLVSQQSANEIFLLIVYVHKQWRLPSWKGRKKNYLQLLVLWTGNVPFYFLLLCWLIDYDDIHNWGKSSHQFPFSTWSTKVEVVVFLSFL